MATEQKLEAAQKLETATKKTNSTASRLLPLTIAAMVCFVIGTSSGYAAWYFWGSNSPTNTAQSNNKIGAIIVSSVQPTNTKAQANKTANNQIAGTLSSAATTEANPTPETEKMLAPAGELNVERGEIALGGGDTQRPVRRVFVTDFAIGATEVTIAQFRDFLEATKDQNNLSNKTKLPNNKDDYPVTNVSWSDATAYCKWLGEKINAEVRLPTEAEWELAARGKEQFKYSWGNEWNDNAAACRETNGTVRAVKSYSLNKSSFGAYDMIGNVWEWTQDAARDEFGKEKVYEGSDAAFNNNVLYIVKGGAAQEPRKNISAQAWFQSAKDSKSEHIGFRYVVIRK